MAQADGRQAPQERRHSLLLGPADLVEEERLHPWQRSSRHRLRTSQATLRRSAQPAFRRLARWQFARGDRHRSACGRNLRLDGQHLQDAAQVHAPTREFVEERLSQKMMEHAGEEGEESYRVSMSDTFILYDILVTGIELPAAIVAAINRKTEQYYIAEEYKFRVEREKRESERKKIEAEGIRDFQ